LDGEIIQHPPEKKQNKQSQSHLNHFIEEDEKRKMSSKTEDARKKNVVKSEKERKVHILEEDEEEESNFYLPKEQNKESQNRKGKSTNPPSHMNESYNYRDNWNKESKFAVEKDKKNNKPKSLLDKGKKHSTFDVHVDRQKNVDKELDLSFLPKELVYNEKSYGESKNNILAAIEILEKAQDNRNQVQKEVKPQDNKSFWSFMNPFKCGQNN